MSPQNTLPEAEITHGILFEWPTATCYKSLRESKVLFAWKTSA
jgi:hypothetical protein